MGLREGHLLTLTGLCGAPWEFVNTSDPACVLGERQVTSSLSLSSCGYVEFRDELGAAPYQRMPFKPCVCTCVHTRACGRR